MLISVIGSTTFMALIRGPISSLIDVLPSERQMLTFRLIKSADFWCVTLFQSNQIYYEGGGGAK